MENSIAKTQDTRLQKISDMTGFSIDQIEVVKNTVAKNTTDIELSYFLSIAKGTGLNPFMKEIWCYKDNKQNLLVFAGRDGFLKKAQESNIWNGITSASVHENDEFSLDMASGEISHKPNFKDRGKIIGAYAISKPKGCEFVTIEWAEMSVYDKGGKGWNNVWDKDPESMIKKVAESHCLKKAYGITGLQVEYDYDTTGSAAVALTHDMMTDEELEKEKVFTDQLEKLKLADTIESMKVIYMDLYKQYAKDPVKVAIIIEEKDKRKKALEGVLI